jgi:hypothetical protein
MAVSLKNTISVAAVLILVAFLAGFLPSYVKARRLEGELRQAKEEIGMANLRDTAALAYLQASQKNYGLATGTSAQFFERAQTLATQTSDATTKKSLEDLMSGRDKITSELAKGDPAAANDLQNLFMKTRQATSQP